MTDFQHLLVSHREAAPPAPGVAPARVATLTLHRPQRKNSLSPVLVNELLHGLDAALGDPSVRVVVLEGGGGTFCAGADLGGGDGDSTLPVKGDFSDLLLALSRAEKPVVAKVRGVAMGGGVGLAAACHFAVTTDDAVWSTPEVHRGLWPMMIMAVLARTVSRRHLLELMLLGDKLSGARAAEMGLASRAVPAGELDEAVDTLCDGLAGRSPTAVSHGLRAYNRQADLRLEESLPMLRDALAELFATEDAQEGIAAFLQRRPPVWTGR
jgi:enoyl-CoA hydratase/carnithine racemase